MSYFTVNVTTTDGGEVALPVVDGSTSYITQDDFANTVNDAWLILMAIFVFRTCAPSPFRSFVLSASRGRRRNAGRQGRRPHPLRRSASRGA